MPVQKTSMKFCVGQQYQYGNPKAQAPNLMKLGGVSLELLVARAVTSHDDFTIRVFSCVL